MYNDITELRKDLMVCKRENKPKSEVLIMLLTEVLNTAKADGNREATKEDISSSVKRLVKRAEQSVSFKVQGSEQELAILLEMLPKGLSDGEILAFVEKAKAIHGSNKGLIMKELKGIEGMDMSKASKMI